MIKSWTQDNYYCRQLLKLLRTYNYSEHFAFRKVLLSREGRFLAGTILSKAIESNCPNAVVTVAKVVDDCLALAVVNSRRIDDGRFIRPEIFDISFESEINSIKYVKGLIGLYPSDEVVLVTGVAQSLAEIQDAVNQIRSLGLVINNCFVLINNIEDKQNVDIGIKLFFIYSQEDFLD